MTDNQPKNYYDPNWPKVMPLSPGTQMHVDRWLGSEQQRRDREMYQYDEWRRTIDRLITSSFGVPATILALPLPEEFYQRLWATKDAWGKIRTPDYEEPPDIPYHRTHRHLALSGLRPGYDHLRGADDGGQTVVPEMLPDLWDLGLSER